MGITQNSLGNRWQRGNPPIWHCLFWQFAWLFASSHMEVSWVMGVAPNNPKSSILVKLSLRNHPFWGTPMTMETSISSLLQGNTPNNRIYPGDSDNFRMTSPAEWNFRPGAAKDFASAKLRVRELENHPFSMGKSTIYMVIFNNKLLVYQRVMGYSLVFSFQSWVEERLSKDTWWSKGELLL